jgi:hypothetical protein
MLKSVEVFDPAKNEWTPGLSMNQVRSGFGAAIIDGKIVVAGGELLDRREALTSVEIFDPATPTWVFAPSMPYELHGNPVATVQSVVYVLGGSDRAGAIDNKGRVLIYRP